MRILIEDIYCEFRGGNIAIRIVLILAFTVLRLLFGIPGLGLGRSAYDALCSFSLIERSTTEPNITIASIVIMLFMSSGLFIWHAYFCCIFRLGLNAKTHLDSMVMLGISALMYSDGFTDDTYYVILKDLSFYLACLFLFAFIMSVVFCVMITMLDVAFKKGDVAKLFAAAAVAIAWGSHICMQLWPTIIANYPNAVL